jgi:DNA-binding CsgD family transcriptional regulator
MTSSLYSSYGRLLLRLLGGGKTRYAKLKQLETPGRQWDDLPDSSALRLARRMDSPSTFAVRVRTLVTVRELEVLELAYDALADKQIAKRLGMSPRTVRTHWEKIFRKLRVNNRFAAVRIWREVSDPR